MLTLVWALGALFWAGFSPWSHAGQPGFDYIRVEPVQVDALPPGYRRARQSEVPKEIDFRQFLVYPMGAVLLIDLNGVSYAVVLEEHFRPPGSPTKPWGKHKGVSLFIRGPGAAGPRIEPRFLCDPSVRPQPNAGLSEEPGLGGCPDGMLRVAGFCVDRFEASLIQELPDGTLVPWSPYHNPGSRKVRAVSLRGAVPQGYISGAQAERACAQAGKRLCRDDEWLRACMGATRQTYPYGPVRRDRVCNDARGVHPALELFPADPKPFSRIGDACINQLPEGLARTGVHSDCVTDDGVFDLMGNLHEWTADPAGTFRGGYYVDTRINGAGCLYVTTAHSREHWDYSTGFRCCAD